jgi:hypothetical protein
MGESSRLLTANLGCTASRLISSEARFRQAALKLHTAHDLRRTAPHSTRNAYWTGGSCGWDPARQTLAGRDADF